MLRCLVCEHSATAIFRAYPTYALLQEAWQDAAEGAPTLLAGLERETATSLFARASHGIPLS
jgi:hypothetical protein